MSVAIKPPDNFFSASSGFPGHDVDLTQEVLMMVGSMLAYSSDEASTTMTDNRHTYPNSPIFGLCRYLSWDGER